jgi:2-oxoglutarate ferredoxin oxidoreductase subunit alpha
VLHQVKDASVGIIGFGSTEPAILEAMDQLQRQDGLTAEFMRIRALPFTEDVQSFLERHATNFVVEMNRDGQMRQLLAMEYPELANRLVPVAFQNGLPASAAWVRKHILEAKPPERRPSRKVAAKRPVRSSAGRRAGAKRATGPARSSAIGRKRK